MDFPVWLNKWIIGNRYLRYHPIWWWYRLMNHNGFRFDDYHMWASFWSSLNAGYLDMNYKWEFEKTWGKGTQPKKIILSKEGFDALVEKLNEPPKFDEKVARVLMKKAPWDD